eukprot:2942082-Rhodomonas_salina.1
MVTRFRNQAPLLPLTKTAARPHCPPSQDSIAYLEETVDPAPALLLPPCSRLSSSRPSSLPRARPVGLGVPGRGSRGAGGVLFGLGRGRLDCSNVLGGGLDGEGERAEREVGGEAGEAGEVVGEGEGEE